MEAILEIIPLDQSFAVTYIRGPSPYAKRECSWSRNLFDFESEYANDIDPSEKDTNCIDFDLLRKIAEQNAKLRKKENDNRLFKKPRTLPIRKHKDAPVTCGAVSPGPSTSPASPAAKLVVAPLKIRLPTKRKSGGVSEPTLIIGNGELNRGLSSKRPQTFDSKKKKSKKTRRDGPTKKPIETGGNGLQKKMSDKKYKKLRQLSKMAAKNFHLLATLFRNKSKSKATKCASSIKRKLATPRPPVPQDGALPKAVTDLFLRGSHSSPQKVSQPSSTPVRRATDDCNIKPSLVTALRPFRYGPKHPFVFPRGRVGEITRTDPATVVPLSPPDDVLTLLNNLTAKVTKAVRQNRGSSFDEKHLDLDTGDDEPRFAKRLPFRLFAAPNQNKSERCLREEGDSRTLSKIDLERKARAAIFDAEMSAVDALRNDATDVEITTKNAIHLYLFGVRSEYGDTANCESDMLKGQLTMPPVWLKKKEYAEMVINGLKWRGHPHVVFVPPPDPLPEEQLDNVDEESNDCARAPVRVQSDTDEMEMNGAATELDTAFGSAHPDDSMLNAESNISPLDQILSPPVTPISGESSSTSANSPFVSFPAPSNGEQMFGFDGAPSEFYNGFGTQRPPVPPPRRGNANEYLESGFSTRTY